MIINFILTTYKTIIYEGGQGLLLDQSNMDDFPHLTPSSVGIYNIHSDIVNQNIYIIKHLCLNMSVWKKS